MRARGSNDDGGRGFGSGFSVFTGSDFLVSTCGDVDGGGVTLRCALRSAIRAAANGEIRRSLTAMTRSVLPASTSLAMMSRLSWLNFGDAGLGLISGSS